MYMGSRSIGETGGKRQNGQRARLREKKTLYRDSVEWKVWTNGLIVFSVSICACDAMKASLQYSQAEKSNNNNHTSTTYTHATRHRTYYSNKTHTSHTFITSPSSSSSSSSPRLKYVPCLCIYCINCIFSRVHAKWVPTYIYTAASVNVYSVRSL